MEEEKKYTQSELDERISSVVERINEESCKILHERERLKEENNNLRKAIKYLGNSLQEESD